MFKQKINFRNCKDQLFDDCKDLIFKQKPIQTQLKEIDKTFQSGENDPAINKKLYSQYLQSLVYYIVHLKKLDSNYQELVLGDILGELELLGQDNIEIWIDEKENVTIFHALARNRHDCTLTLSRCYKLFAKSLSELFFTQDKDGFTPLNTACKEGVVSNILSLQMQTLIVLGLEEYLNLLATGNKEQFTPFMSLAHQESGYMAMPLLINAFDIDKYKSILNATNVHGCTALQLACHRGNSKTIKILLGMPSLEPKRLDNNKNSPLHHIAFSKIDDDNVLTNLIDSNFINAQNSEGNTPLNIACRNGNAQLAALLLKKGADPFIVNNKGISPAYNALRNNKIACFKELVVHLANRGQLMLLLLTPINANDDSLLFNICKFKQTNFFDELILQINKLKSEELCQILMYKNKMGKSIFDVCLNNEISIKILDSLLELAARQFDFKNYLDYTNVILRSDNPSVITSLLYQSVTNRNYKEFMQFINQTVSGKETLRDIWKEEPKILNRIDRYVHQDINNNNSFFSVKKEGESVTESNNHRQLLN